jgi:mono/diheme cytochrome c family protein
MSAASFYPVSILWRFFDRDRPRGRVGARAMRKIGNLALLGATIFVATPTARSQEPKRVDDKPPEAGGSGGPVAPADLVASYKDNCASCHGSEGTGNRTRKGSPNIPDFTSLAWQMSQTDLEIAHRIRDGHEPTMPAYREELTEPQMLALSIYVRSFSFKATNPAKGSEPGPSDTNRPATASRMTSSDLYQAYCLACHDAGGRAARVRKAMPEIPDFSDLAWQASRTDAALKLSILDGKGKFMLPMKDKLGPDDADQMIAFLRAFGGGKQLVVLEPRKSPLAPPGEIPAPVARPAPVAAVPAQRPETVGRLRAVTRLYRQYCLSCHGVDGKGTEMRPGMATLPDFSGRAWQEGKHDEQIAGSVLDGKGSLMPSFQGRVSADQARDLVAYVRAFGPPRPSEAKPRSDFERRFQELTQQWDDLEKQLQALSPKPSGPGRVP